MIMEVKLLYKWCFFCSISVSCRFFNIPTIEKRQNDINDMSYYSIILIYYKSIEP